MPSVAGKTKVFAKWCVLLAVVVMTVSSGVALSASAVQRVAGSSGWPNCFSVAKEHSGERTFAAASSFAVTKEEALAEARARLIAAMRADVVQTMPKHEGIGALLGRLLRRSLDAMIDDSLSTDGVAVHTYVRRFDQSYGTLFKAHIAVAVQDTLLRDLGVRYRSAARARAVQTIFTATALVVLTVLMWLLYAALDARTRGYLTWRLRACTLASWLLLAALFVVWT